MNIKSKRLICLFLTALMVIPFFTPAVRADENIEKLSGNTVERVYEEILTGNITNEEDVLKVALAQYTSKTQSAVDTYDARSVNPTADEEGNTSPVISQVLERTTDENGVTTVLVADTGLLVTDANGDAVYTDRLYNSATGALSQYSITATHTIYYYYRYGFDGMAFTDEQVKGYKMVTVLNYGGVYTATLLEHCYWQLDANGINGEYLVGSYNSPVEATRYTTYPANVISVNWMDACSDQWAGFGSVAKVYYGTKILEISIDVNSITVSDMDGTW